MSASVDLHVGTPGAAPAPGRSVPLAGATGGCARAKLRALHGQTVSWFAVEGGPRAGAISEVEGLVVERAVRTALDVGVPIVGELATSGADVTVGVPALHAWGKVAAALHQASGVVPVVLAVKGPCVSGPALLLGLADHVIFAEAGFAYVSGPDAVEETTGVRVDHERLGGSRAHATRSGLASVVVPAGAELDAAAEILWYLPSNDLEDPLPAWVDDPVERRCERARAIVPDRSTAGYDVRDVIGDVVDAGSFLEVRAAHARNMVTAFGRLDGRSVGIVANQPQVRAGTLDIDGARKAARHVQSCDAFNLPLVTFVDTPGFEPGKTLEWRGIIRHGAQLVFAYAEATVPRLAVILRKAYGGAYIVMDSKGMGNDWCVAWPTAEIAVMGAEGAVDVLHARRLAEIVEVGDRAAERERLLGEYRERLLSPWPAAERGYVDAVIEPEETRAVLCTALAGLADKREPPRASRRHSNTPL